MEEPRLVSKTVDNVEAVAVSQSQGMIVIKKRGRAGRRLARVEVFGWAQQAVLELKGAKEDVLVECLHIATMDPDGPHKDVGLGDGFPVERLGVGPDMMG